MYKYFLAALFATLFASTSYAQHSDIEFGFEDPSNPVFEVLLDEFTDEGIAVAEGEFITFGAFVTSDSPGFITPDEEGEVLTVAVGDQVFVRVLDASAEDSPTDRGAGYVNFYSPGNPELQGLDSSFGTFEITGNTPGSNADSVSVFAGDELVSGEAELFLAAGSDGNTMSDVPPSLGEEDVELTPGRIHTHLGFDLTGDLATTRGAVGLLLQFSVVRAGTGDVIDSDPFFLIFNNGLSEDPNEEINFETALLAFGLDEGDEAEPILGDINMDGMIDFSDVQPFVDLLISGEFQAEADFDGDGEVTFLDIAGFIQALMNV